MSTILSLLAQVDTSTVAQYGLPGIVLAWFMLRAEKRLGSIEDIVRDLTKSILLDVVSRPDASHSVREEAEKLMDKIRPSKRGN